MTKICRTSVMLTLTLAMVAAVGCQEESDSAKSGAARGASGKPGPEESFEMIVETFRRGVEDVPIGFVQPNAEGHSMMTGRNEVSHELIAPANKGEPYKGVITVTSQSRYSIKHMTSDEEEQEQASEERSSLDEEADKFDLQIYDDDLISRPRGDKRERRAQTPTDENSEQSVMRQADRQERKYELLYESGTWRLVTELDPETEQSIANAFKRALELQN